MFFPGLTNLPSFNFKKSVLFIWNKQYLWNIVQIRKKYILPSTKLRKWKPRCKLTKVHVTWDLQKNTNFYQFFQPIYMRLIPIILARGRIPKHVTRQLLQRQFSPSPPPKKISPGQFSVSDNPIWTNPILDNFSRAIWAHDNYHSRNFPHDFEFP